jgi:hypothetical protein
MWSPNCHLSRDRRKRSTLVGRAILPAAACQAALSSQTRVLRTIGRRAFDLHTVKAGVTARSKSDSFAGCISLRRLSGFFNEICKLIEFGFRQRGRGGIYQSSHRMHH